MATLTKKWCVNCELHIPRKVGYIGKQISAGAEKLRLSFDGVTLPGLYFMATQLQWSCVLFALKSIQSDDC